jgi:hypothetical protein
MPSTEMDRTVQIVDEKLNENIVASGVHLRAS